MKSILFDAIEIGETYETETFRMTPERIKAFAIEFDPQPMHLDEEEAKQGPFGELTASGWHTLAVAMRLMAEAKPFGETPLIGVGVTDIKFLKPVIQNAKIYVEAIVTAKRTSTKPGRGFVKMQLTVYDSNSSEAVLSETWTVLVPTN